MYSLADLHERFAKGRSNCIIGPIGAHSRSTTSIRQSTELFSDAFKACSASTAAFADDALSSPSVLRSLSALAGYGSALSLDF